MALFRAYKCTRCEEEVLVAPVEDPGPRRD